MKNAQPFSKGLGLISLASAFVEVGSIAHNEKRLVFLKTNMNFLFTYGVLRRLLYNYQSDSYYKC